MTRSGAKTPAEYVAGLPAERAAVIRKVRAAVRKALPKGYVESMTWGMPTYEVPLSGNPKTYNGKPLMYAAIAAQKSHYAIYLTGPYQDPRLMKLLEEGFAKAGKKLDMGKSCVRFRKLEDVPLEVIQEVVAAVDVDEFVAQSEAARAAATGGGRKAARRRGSG